MRLIDKFAEWLNKGMEPVNQAPEMEKRVMNIFTLVPEKEIRYQRDLEEFGEVLDALHLWEE